MKKLISYVLILLTIILSFSCRDKNAAGSSNSFEGTSSRHESKRYTNVALRAESLTLISPSECEVTSNGRTLLGSFTEVDSQIRVVLQEGGATRVLYFTITSPDKGKLISKDTSSVYLTGELLEEYDRNQAEERRKMAEERKRARDAEIAARAKHEEELIKNAPKAILGKWRIKGFNLSDWHFMNGGAWRGIEGVAVYSGKWSIDGRNLHIEARAANFFFREDILLEDVKPDTLHFRYRKERDVTGQRVSFSSPQSLASLITGKWKYGRTDFLQYLTLDLDGKFSHAVDGKTRQGTWEIVDDQLIEHITKIDSEDVSPVELIFDIWVASHVELKLVPQVSEQAVIVAEKVL